MSAWLVIVLSAGIGLVGSGTGTLLAWPLRRPGKTLPGCMMGLSCGMMLAIVMWDMVPEAVVYCGMVYTTLGVIIGWGGVSVLQGKQQRTERRQARQTRSTMLKTGVLLITGMALHNFPEGLAIGSGLAQGTAGFSNYGIHLAILIVLHDIPEGVAVAVPFRLAGYGQGRVMVLGLLSGVPTALGAIAGYMLGGVDPFVMGLCVAFAGGAMLFVSLVALWPLILASENRKMALIPMAGGFLLGTGMVVLL